MPSAAGLVNITSVGPAYGTAATRARRSSEPKETRNGRRGSTQKTCGSQQHTTSKEERGPGKEQSERQRPERDRKASSKQQNKRIRGRANKLMQKQTFAQITQIR